jgi:steroid delta-isomerase-like uncharacterized protein
MATDMKQLSRRMVEEVFGRGNMDAIEEICDASFKAHDPLIGEHDVSGLKGAVQMYRRAFPDLSGKVQQSCCEGETCSTRWTMTGTHRGAILGVQPTGRKFTVEGISFERYRNGKLVESYTQWDTLHFLQELGVAPRLEMSAQAGEAERPGRHM